MDFVVVQCNCHKYSIAHYATLGNLFLDIFICTLGVARALGQALSLANFSSFALEPWERPGASLVLVANGTASPRGPCFDIKKARPVLAGRALGFWAILVPKCVGHCLAGRVGQTLPILAR